MREKGVFMTIQETKQTPAEKQEEQKFVVGAKDALEKELSSSFAKDSEFAKSLNLPAEQPEEEVEEQEEVVESEDEQEQVEGNEEESAEEQEEEDEDLIPKSKVDKRFQSLTAQNKALEAKINALEKQATVGKSPEVVKLEKMSENELETLIDQIEDAKFQAITDGDRDKYNELSSLGKNANKVLREAPKRFVEQQESLTRATASQIIEDLELQNNVEAQNEILAGANHIYSTTPVLHSKPEGYSQALNLSAQHWQKISKLSAGKSKARSKATKLKRDVNNLKRKTSLDGKIMKGDIGKKHTGSLKKKALSKDANFNDKLNFAKSDGLLGDLSRYQK